MRLPTGEVTFLFTDIEGSTRLWEDQPEAMREALAKHDEIARIAIEQNGGVVFKTVGDAFYAAFSSGSEAVRAALEFQRGLAFQEWGRAVPRARAALHTGWADERGGDYFGPTLNRVARLLITGHGGQVLLSAATAELARSTLPEGCSLSDLGHHRLKDLQQPERVWQLAHPDLPGGFPPLRSLNFLRHNLPIQLTSFIGRDRELAEAQSQLASGKLLTMTGPGGCGKTRLALQVGAELLDAVEDGVWLVELAAIGDDSRILQAIASAVGVREEADRALLQTLVEWLRTRRLLLMLDNCEHLLDSAARVVEQVLRSCPGVRILATSRAALNVYGEKVLRVRSLPVPDPNQRASVQALMEVPSVRLFVDRASSSRAGFSVPDASARTLATVCHQLDGIPLALELAAARLRSMPLEQLEQRLSDRFRLLTGGSRTALPRQQTLRATIDWSFDLLTEPERLLLVRLGVFAGGWDLAAAEAICAVGAIDSLDVLDLLSSLVDKSLAAYDEQQGRGRYRMLATLRHYCQERVRETQDGSATSRRHLDYFAGLVRAADLDRAPAADAWDPVADDYDNVRAALDFALKSGAANEATQICLGLAGFWEARGWLREGAEALQRCVSLAGEAVDGRERARLLTAAGWFCQLVGENAPARQYHDQSLEQARASGDQETEASALNNLGLLAQAEGRHAEAAELLAASLELARGLPDERRLAARLSNLGMLEGAQSRCARASALLQEARLIYARHSDTLGEASCLCNLADVALRQGRGGDAEDLAAESSRLFTSLGYEPGMATALGNLAEAALLQGRYRVAAQRISQALSLCSRLELSGLVSELLQMSERALKGLGVSDERAVVDADPRAAVDRVLELLDQER